MAKIFHCADLHYCAKNMKWVNRAFDFAVSEAVRERCDLAVIAGDSFESSTPTHDPSVSAYMNAIAFLAEQMPVIVLQGTHSHDRPGSLDMLRTLSAHNPVIVADRPDHFMIARNASETDIFEINETLPDEFKPVCAVGALPSLNKADPQIAKNGPQEYVRSVLRSLAKNNRDLGKLGVPTILIAHGTVVGSLTESNHAMVSPDHEFSAETLALAEADAVMLGHIHKHQEFIEAAPSGSTVRIAYPGSLTRLVYGHHDPCGFLIWDVSPGAAKYRFHEAPSRKLLEIEFDGPPDMDELIALASDCDSDTAVRVRFSIDQEHADSVDRGLIREMFSIAEKIEIQGTVNPIQSVRSAGIGRALTPADKIEAWANTTGDADSVPDLVDRLQMLESMDPDRIVSVLINKNGEEKAA